MVILIFARWRWSGQTRSEKETRGRRDGGSSKRLSIQNWLQEGSYFHPSRWGRWSYGRVRMLCNSAGGWESIIRILLRWLPTGGLSYASWSSIIYSCHIFCWTLLCITERMEVFGRYLPQYPSAQEQNQWEKSVWYSIGWVNFEFHSPSDVNYSGRWSDLRVPQICTSPHISADTLVFKNNCRC